MGRNARTLALACAASLSLIGASPVHATVIFSSNAEAGTCGAGVPTGVWDYTQSGDSPNSRMYYSCDTPVPGSGRAKYFRINNVNLQHDSWNIRNVGRVNLAIGTTYYLGGFFRFDRINGNDVWRDTGSCPDSYDKLWEFNNGNGGSARAVITAGYPDWANCSTGKCDHRYSFGAYLGMTSCSSNCIYEQVGPNISPYGPSNPFFCDYGKWYAVVLGYTPSNGSQTNGRLQLWINGVKTTDRNNIKTQDTTSPYFEWFYYSGTVAQPGYDAPAHIRKIDHLIFADSLTDIQNAGLMSDPEAGGIRAPANLRIQ